MSQMFIGIIGIVVVIGLAIAGAVYFGDQFQQSRTKSRAAAAVAGTSQVAHAATLAYTTDGVQLKAAADVTAQLVNTGYLSSVPTNPVVPTNAPRLMTLAGVVASGAAEVAAMDLGGAAADETCVQIARQTGQNPAATAATITTTSFNTAIAASVSGCIKAGTGAGAGLTVGNNYAYTKI